MNWLKALFDIKNAAKVVKSLKKIFKAINNGEQVKFKKPKLKKIIKNLIFENDDKETKDEEKESSPLKDEFLEVIDSMEGEFGSVFGSLDFMREDVMNMTDEELENLNSDSIVAKLHDAYNAYSSSASEGLKKMYEYYADAVVSNWKNLVSYYKD